MTFKIVRGYQNRKPLIIKRGLTREQAVAHVMHPEHFWATAKGKHGVARTKKHGIWLDGYTEE
jgi:hypothetical protein